MPKILPMTATRSFVAHQRALRNISPAPWISHVSITTPGRRRRLPGIITAGHPLATGNLTSAREPPPTTPPAMVIPAPSPSAPPFPKLRRVPAPQSTLRQLGTTAAPANLIVVSTSTAPTTTSILAERQALISTLLPFPPGLKSQRHLLLLMVELLTNTLLLLRMVLMSFWVAMLIFKPGTLRTRPIEFLIKVS